MPVILGPDGPSLGGFVCPATIIEAELWKMGQLKAGDIVRFVAVSIDEARRRKREKEAQIAQALAPKPRRPAHGARRRRQGPSTRARRSCSNAARRATRSPRW